MDNNNINNISVKSIITKHKNISDTEIDGDKVMMDLEKGKYFMLNAVASEIWSMINQPRSIKEIIQKLLEQYEVNYDTCEKQVIDFVEYLASSDLIDVK